MSRWRDKRGAVLVLTLVTVLALAMLLAAASFLFVGGSRRARMTVAALQAHYLAEAGVEYAIEELKEDWDTVGSLGERAFPSSDPLGSFEVTVRNADSDGKEKEIESKGIVSGYTKTVKVRVRKGSGFPPIFRNALASSTDIELTGNSRIYSSNEEKIKGNVYAHGRISLRGNTKVTGSVSSALSGGVTTQGNVSVGEDIFAGPEYRQEIPTVENSLREAWEEKARTGGIHQGTLTYSSNNYITLSSIYINGDLRISGNSTIDLADNAVVYVRGKISISGNTTIRGQGIIISEGVIEITGNVEHQLNQPANIAFVSLSSGESKITGNGEVTGVFFIPQGSLKIAGNSEIFGAVVANRVDFTGNAKIKYNADLLDSDVTWNPLKLLRVVKWRET